VPPAQQPLAVGELVVGEAIGHHAAFLSVLQESRQLPRIPQYELLVQLMQPSYEQQSVAYGMSGTGSGAIKQYTATPLSPIDPSVGHCRSDVHFRQGEAGTSGPEPTGAAVVTRSRRSLKPGEVGMPFLSGRRGPTVGPAVGPAVVTTHSTVMVGTPEVWRLGRAVHIPGLTLDGHDGVPPSAATKILKGFRLEVVSETISSSSPQDHEDPGKDEVVGLASVVAVADGVVVGSSVAVGGMAKDEVVVVVDGVGVWEAFTAPAMTHPAAETDGCPLLGIRYAGCQEELWGSASSTRR